MRFCGMRRHAAAFFGASAVLIVGVCIAVLRAIALLPDDDAWIANLIGPFGN